MTVVRVRNLGEVARKIEALARAGGEENVSGLRVIAEEGLTDINASRPGHGVPVDTGALRRSGIVIGPDTRKAVQITYGGAAAPYALRQHETLEYRHPVGEARWLIRWLERFEAGHGPMEALRAQGKAAIDAARRA